VREPRRLRRRSARPDKEAGDELGEIIGIAQSVAIEIGGHGGVGAGQSPAAIVKGSDSAEVFWNLRSFATTRSCTWAIPLEAGSCQS
jgi:hypothetical protein